ncbi:unnamed protein product [Plutella xylostella]|uniref:(diamondback moth) hypothetical protein n=1 Tax=Plutella xylostella TaxID=51655 RepID=A0A8S4E2M5_PLUXY|nr:unnamed protein product [Plutella xylostella]
MFSFTVRAMVYIVLELKELIGTCDLLFKTFSCWRTLPALMGLQRQQEARKARWREKVLQVVPDYTPPED